MQTLGLHSWVFEMQSSGSPSHDMSLNLAASSTAKEQVLDATLLIAMAFNVINKAHLENICRYRE